MKNKKLIIGIIAGVVVLVAAGVGGFLIYKNQHPATAAVAGQQGSRNFGGTQNANFRLASGKILSVSGSDLIIDSGTAQSLVTTDANTKVAGTTVSDLNTVVQVGNLVSLQLQTDNTTNIKTVTVVTKEDPSNLTAFRGGFGSQGGSGFRPSGAAQGGNGQTNAAARRQQLSRGGSGNGANANQVFGTISAISGTTITITVGLPNPSTTPTVTPTTQQYDISGSTFKVMKTLSVSDLQQGETVQAVGTLQGSGQILAQTITVQ